MEHSDLLLSNATSGYSIIPDEPEYYRRELYERYYSQPAASYPEKQRNGTANHGLGSHADLGFPNLNGPGFPSVVQPHQILPHTSAPDLGEILLCGGDCVGAFATAHQCLRERSSLAISCLEANCQPTSLKITAFRRHYKSVHYPEMLGCPFPNCDRVGQNGFSRKDNLLQHRRIVHREDITKVNERLKGKSSTRTIVDRPRDAGGPSGNAN